MSTTKSIRNSRGHLSRFATKCVSIAWVLILLAGGAFAFYRFSNSGLPVNFPDSTGDLQTADVPADVVKLTDNKLRAAAISTETVKDRSLQDVRVIAGRIRYNDATHVDVKAPTAGTVIKMFVKTGDKVLQGQPLVIVNSQEIGRARADVLKHESELSLAQHREKWQGQVARNLKDLLARLNGTDQVDDIEKDFSNRPLGTYRDTVLSSWLNLKLANQLQQQAEPLAASGAISKRTLLERVNVQRVAEAEFHGIKEQVAFDAKQLWDQANIDAIDAQRRLQISRQHLYTLLGYEEAVIHDSPGTPLSQLEIRAPFDATVENRLMSNSERVKSGESLLVLADTSTLYVAVDIRERDWHDIHFQPGQELTVTVPALPHMKFTAKAHYMGREVMSISNAVPLVAVIDNAAGLLRPGMFVRVEIPVGAARMAVAVPRQSLLRHENKQFVFVAYDDQTFRRVDVETGQTIRDWVEVTSGVQTGQRVVSNGAFQMKSSLLLEGEEE